MKSSDTTSIEKYFIHDTAVMRCVSLRPDLQQGLKRLIAHVKNRIGYDITMVEIGCYNGEATVEFAKVFDHVIAIDPWANGYDENDGASYQNDMEEIEDNFDWITRNYRNILKHKHKSDCNIESFIGKLGFVYIDGLHTYDGVKNDITTWLPKIHATGLIGGHDWNIPGVKLAVLERFDRHDIALFEDSSWVVSVNSTPEMLTFNA